MWELDYEESWAPKNWCFWTVVLEKTLESPLDCKEIQPVHPKGNQSCIFIGRTDAEAEAPILWPPDAKNWLIGKDPDTGKDWRREEKGMTQDEMVGWHHWLNGHEFEQALVVGDGQGGLVCCGPWGHRVGNNWVTELNWQSNRNGDTEKFCIVLNADITTVLKLKDTVKGAEAKHYGASLGPSTIALGASCWCLFAFAWHHWIWTAGQVKQLLMWLEEDWSSINNGLTIKHTTWAGLKRGYVLKVHLEKLPSLAIAEGNHHQQERESSTGKICPPPQPHRTVTHWEMTPREARKCSL